MSNGNVCDTHIHEGEVKRLGMDGAIMGGVLAGFIILWVIFAIGLYILSATAAYKMYKKARVNYAWLAFIPIASLWPFMWTVGKSAWNILWLCIPVVDVIFMLIWQARLYRAFGLSPWLLLIYLGCLIPMANLFVGIAFLVIHCYIGFSKNVQYRPDFENRFTSSDFTM
jgi:hypothetical protein